MKRKLKKYKYIIISFSILLFWLFIEGVECHKEGLMSKDPLIMFYHLLQDMNLSYLQILAPLFIMVPATYHFHRELHTGTIKNYLTRIKYNEYIKNKYREALTNIWLLPIFSFVILITCCLLTKSISFGSGYELYDWISSPDSKYINNLPLFMITYPIVLLIHSILYVNISLIYCKKNSNFLVTIILSYLTFIALDIFMETFIGNFLLARILNIHDITDSLNLFNIWIYDNVISLPFMIIYSCLLVISSLFIVFIKYKDKEGVIIESEK